MRALRIALLTVLALASAGCLNPFRPAAPERPLVANVRPDFSSPDDVLGTLIDAMADKGETNGSSAYTDAFAATYLGSVDPEIRQRWSPDFGGVLPNLDRELEARFYTSFTRLFASGAYELEFYRDVQLPADDESDDRVTYNRYYRISLVQDDGDSDVICTGNAEIVMVLADARWSIVSWADHYDRTIGPNPSNGQLSWGSRHFEAAQGGQ